MLEGQSTASYSKALCWSAIAFALYSLYKIDVFRNNYPAEPLQKVNLQAFSISQIRRAHDLKLL